MLFGWCCLFYGFFRLACYMQNGGWFQPYIYPNGEVPKNFILSLFAPWRSRTLHEASLANRGPSRPEAAPIDDGIEDEAGGNPPSSARSSSDAGGGKKKKGKFDKRKKRTVSLTLQKNTDADGFQMRQQVKMLRRWIILQMVFYSFHTRHEERGGVRPW